MLRTAFALNTAFIRQGVEHSRASISSFSRRVAVARPPTPPRPSVVRTIMSAQMKAAIRSQYGSADVVQVAEMPVPEPQENQVRIRVAAASINQADVFLMRGQPYLIRLMTGVKVPKQRIIGQDVAGVVESIGSDVNGLKVGDKVFGELHLGGTFAEYTCATEEQLELVPINSTLEEAAALALAGITAVQAVDDKAKVKEGQSVLINGASGGVGTYMVQVAKARGAKVTAVCSKRNAERAKQLGADHVIDYSTDDFTARPEKYDAILDVAVSHSLKEYRRVMHKKGTYVGIGAPAGNWFGPILSILSLRVASFAGSQTFDFLNAEPNKEDLRKLKTLFETGKIKPQVVSTVPLENAADALRQQDEGHSQGKTVISLSRS